MAYVNFSKGILSAVTDVCFYFLCVYALIYNIAKVCYGFPLEAIITDLIAVTISTNVDEVLPLLVNAQSKSFLSVYKVLPAIIFYYLSGKICVVVMINQKLHKSLHIVALFCFVVMFFLPNTTFSEFMVRLPNGLSDIFETSKYIDLAKKFKWNSVSDIKGKSTVVIVLGETTRGDHMYINGYKRNTNPYLSKENIITFDNCISLDVHTLVATPFILTRKDLNQDNIYKLHPETSLISAFKEAGYRTYYVSYLNKVHSGDNAINQIVKEADEYIKRPWGNGYDGDSLSLPIMKDIIQNNDEEKKLVILKLIGSHINFQDRYPKIFDVFKPSFTTENYNGDDINKKNIFINTYDNSILYTDYVVGHIIKYLKNIDGDCTLSFISDHGISIYDDNKTLYINYKKANYNIPCFFWFNEKAIKSIGEGNIFVLKSNIHKPIDSTYFLDTILQLNDIKTDRLRGKSLLNYISEEDNRKVIYGSKIIPYIDIMQ